VLCKELGDKLIGSESIEGLACSAAARGEAERAAKLFGAAEALREAAGYQQASRDRSLREPFLAAARSRVDGAAWITAWENGRSMAFEDAVEYALLEEEATSSPTVPQELSTSEPPHMLTRRQEEVAVLVARGLTNPQIAARLVISEHTAATHVRRILKKLGLHSRAQIGSWLAEQEFAPSD
jgi:non-specific serine/threonine protein kinase